MNRKRLTNTEFVRQLMEFGQHGILNQLFVIGALSDMVEQVLAADFGTEMNSPLPPMVDAETWKSVANEVKHALDRQYGAQKHENDPNNKP